jgi:hypothetical protein
MIKKIKTKINGGDTLVEMLFYIALFALLSIVVINSMITMMKSFKEVTIQREITQGGEIMERISREIGGANKINSVVDVNGDLKLDTKDDVGADKLVEFVLTNSNIRLLENSNYTGDLNSPNIKINTLTFNQINTAKGEAIKVFLTISSKHDSQNRNFNYYDTIVLRGNY